MHVKELEMGGRRFLQLGRWMIPVDRITHIDLRGYRNGRVQVYTEGVGEAIRKHFGVENDNN